MLITAVLLLSVGAAGQQQFLPQYYDQRWPVDVRQAPVPQQSHQRWLVIPAWSPESNFRQQPVSGLFDQWPMQQARSWLPPEIRPTARDRQAMQRVMTNDLRRRDIPMVPQHPESNKDTLSRNWLPRTKSSRRRFGSKRVKSGARQFSSDAKSPRLLDENERFLANRPPPPPPPARFLPPKFLENLHLRVSPSVRRPPVSRPPPSSVPKTLRPPENNRNSDLNSGSASQIISDGQSNRQQAASAVVEATAKKVVTEKQQQQPSAVQQYSTKIYSNVNEAFLTCCQERHVDKSCESRCNFDVLNRRVLTAMFVGTDPCPQKNGRTLMACAAQDSDHTACCAAKSVHKTTAGEKCLGFCQMSPNSDFQADISMLPCWAVLKDIKGCFKDAIVEKYLMAKNA